MLLCPTAFTWKTRSLRGLASLREKEIRGVLNQPSERPHELFRMFSTCVFSFISGFKFSLYLLCNFDIFTLNPISNITILPHWTDTMNSNFQVLRLALRYKMQASHKLPGSHWFKSTHSWHCLGFMPPCPLPDKQEQMHELYNTQVSVCGSLVCF